MNGLPLFALLAGTVFMFLRWHRNRGASPTVTTGQFWSSIPGSARSFVQIHWAKLVVPPAAAIFALFFFMSSFPNWWDGYVRWGGPTYSLVFAVLLIAIINATLDGNWRHWSLRMVVPLVALTVAWTLFVRAPFFDPPCPTANTADGQTCLERQRTEEQREATQQALKVEASNQAMSVSDRCSGVSKVLTVGDTEMVEIRTTRCQARVEVITGCVQWYNLNEYFVTRSCTGHAPSIPGITYARADPGVTAKVRTINCTTRATGNSTESCS